MTRRSRLKRVILLQMDRTWIILSASGVVAVALTLFGTGPTRADDANGPLSDVDYWLKQAETVDANDPNSVDVDPDAEGSRPFRRSGRFVRSDALPGVVRLSDGRLIPGGIYGTREKPWRVYVADEKRWRQIPPLAVLSITAKVAEEKMELEWRWKAMGEPEKVYTGRKIPVRRFLWTFHLLDDTTVTGVVKGQPLWVETDDGRAGPFLLHERSKGKPDTSLKDLVYVQKVIISRRMMDKTAAHLKTCDAHRGRLPDGNRGATTRPSR